MNPSPRIGKPPRAPHGWTRVLACLWLALGLAAAVPRGQAASAGSPTVAASLSDPTVDVGQSAEYRIDVVGRAADHPPAVPAVEGLRFTFAGQNQSTQFDFNTLTKTVTSSYVYSVEATRAGRFVIPGSEVQIGGGVLRTLPVTLTATGEAPGAGNNRSVFVELTIAKKTAYLGETIPVEVRTYFGMNVPAQLTPDLELNGEGFSVQKFTPQKDTGTPVAVEGTNYRVAEARSAITGLKVGTLSVGPVEVDPYVQLPRPRQRRSQYTDPFDAFFNNGFNGGNLMRAQQVKLLSPVVPLEIKGLPAQGKPADFTGAIGQFKLDAEAEPRRAQTGDPITVHLLLSGRGNFDRVGAPGLSDDQGLRTYPATAHFKADDEVNLSGVKTFDQVVIAEGPRASLPSYHFNYFDPDTGKYAVLDTPPIPVRVEGSSLATPTPALAAAAPAPGTTPKPTPAPTPHRAEDILYIRAEAGPRLARDAFLPLYRQRGFWMAQGGGLAVLLGLGAVGALRTRARNEAARLSARRQRQQAEQQRALQLEETGRREFSSAATRLAQMRAAAASGRADEQPGAQEICRDRSLDAQTAGSVQEMFRRHDELAYSGGSVAQEPVPPEERRGVLATLETLGKNPRA